MLYHVHYVTNGLDHDLGLIMLNEMPGSFRNNLASEVGKGYLITL